MPPPSPTRLGDADLLARLVGYDTTSRLSNLPLADFIADYLDRPGVRIDRHPSPDGRKANLVVRVGPEPDRDRQGLVLSGHMDVVPPGEEGWRSDPFALTDAGDAWIARGACDMKGFLALALNRAAALDPVRLRHPLALVLTYDEEVGTVGARRLAESGLPAESLPRRAVIGEPTELRAARMHKGHLKLRLDFKGRSAHSGYPHLGENAIEPAARAILGLAGLRDALKQERPALGEQFGEVPHVALNVAQVSGGTAINVVPESCEVEFGIRLLPGMSSEEMVDRVRLAVREALGATPFSLAVTGDSPPMLLHEDATFYRSLCSDLEQRDSHAVSFATDAGWLQTLGLECVIFGPGSIEVAHKPNESLPKDQFAEAGGILDGLIARFCREG